jgi:hypothetical protein
MSESSDEQEEGENTVGGQPTRRRQLRINAEILAAEAQKVAARAAVRNARYMLWAVIVAAISTVVSAAGAVFGVIFNLNHH